jgi:hypothetical protein
MRGVPPLLAIRSRNVHDEAMKVAIGLLALTLFGGCEAPLAGAPCPCLDGYFCDSARDVCIQFSDGGTGMDAAFPDGGFPEPDGSGPVLDAATSEDGGSPPFDAGFDPDAGGLDGGPSTDGGAAPDPVPQ